MSLTLKIHSEINEDNTSDYSQHEINISKNLFETLEANITIDKGVLFDPFYENVKEELMKRWKQKNNLKTNEKLYELYEFLYKNKSKKNCLWISFE